LTSEIRYISSDQPGGNFEVLLPRVPETEYDVTHHGDSFFIRTNDAAKTFRVIQAPVADPSKPNWKEILPARPDITVERVFALRDFLITEERDLGLVKIRVANFTTSDTHYIDFPEPVYTAGLGPNAE